MFGLLLFRRKHNQYSRNKISNYQESLYDYITAWKSVKKACSRDGAEDYDYWPLTPFLFTDLSICHV